MSRVLTASFITELTENQVYPALFFEGQFTGTTLRLWTGLADISWNSETWSGNGWFHGVELPADEPEVAAQAMGVVLSGIPATLISLILNDADQTNTGKLWFGFLDENDKTSVIADPFLMFSGTLDVPTLTYGADVSQIRISYESLLVDLDRPRLLRYTDESQQLLFAGDRGFEYMTFLQQWQGFWGKERAEIGT